LWRRLGICFAFLVFLSACQEQIVHDLSEREANKVISHLSAAKLDAHKVIQPDGRWAISVSQDSIVAALAYLDTQRVLATRDVKGPIGKGSMIPSREEQWFRYERSVAMSIEESLAAIPGVLEARVHTNIPEEDPLFGSSGRDGSGSVLLVVDEKFVAHDEEISALVGGAAGIPREVIRILKSTTTLPKPLEGGPASEVTKLLPSIASTARLPWTEGVAVCAALVAVLGIRHMRTRGKKKVIFSIPKALDFEG
jgi:type III secretory pathway lipoprotein EscJ